MAIPKSHLLTISYRGPCAWVVTGEIFPLKARARGLSMTTASNWLLNWAIAYSTPYLVNPGAGNANLGSKVFFVSGMSPSSILCFRFQIYCRVLCPCVSRCWKNCTEHLRLL